MRVDPNAPAMPTSEEHGRKGMDIRTTIAMHAMQSLLTRRVQMESRRPNESADDFTKRCEESFNYVRDSVSNVAVAYADHLIERLNQESPDAK